MLIERTSLFRELVMAVLKTTVTVIALALVYPYIVMAIARALSPGAAPP